MSRIKELFEKLHEGPVAFNSLLVNDNTESDIVSLKSCIKLRNLSLGYQLFAASAILYFLLDFNSPNLTVRFIFAIACLYGLWKAFIFPPSTTQNTGMILGQVESLLILTIFTFLNPHKFLEQYLLKGIFSFVWYNSLKNWADILGICILSCSLNTIALLIKGVELRMILVSQLVYVLLF